MNAQAQKAILEIREKGFAVIPSVLDEKTIEKYKLLIEGTPSNSYAHKNTHRFHGDPKNISLISNLQNKDFEFWRLIAHPISMDICDALLREGSYGNNERYQLQGAQARTIRGPEKGQQLHIDSKLPGLPYSLALVVGWTLTEFTETNGGTRFVPGSHKRQSFPPEGHSEESEVIASCPAGSMVVFTGGVWHGSSPKKDDSTRIGMFFTYSRWFMRQNYRINKAIPKHIRDELTEDMIELSGAYFEAPINEMEREVKISTIPQW